LAVRRVEDTEGNLLWLPEPGLGPQAVDERVAYLITDILSDDSARIPTFGEGSLLVLDRPAAVKTGTTTDFRDNWTVGYTPELAVGVWAGNADNEPMRNISGISGAAPIWHTFMEAALKGQPARSFQRPDGLVEAEVCALSGQRPSADCPLRVRELLITGTEPSETCTMHRRIAVDRASGQPATNATPSDQVVYRAVTVLPPEAQAWARENGATDFGFSILDFGLRTEGEALDSRSGQSPASPGLALSSPDAGAVYRIDPTLPRDAQRIVVAAHPLGNTTLRSVSLRIDGQPLADLEAPPFRTLWQLEPGPHIFSASAVTSGGRALRSSEVRIEVR